MKILKIVVALFFSICYLYSECSDLNYNNCVFWSDFCEWNEDTEACQEIGGGGESTRAIRL